MAYKSGIGSLVKSLMDIDSVSPPVAKIQIALTNTAGPGGVPAEDVSAMVFDVVDRKRYVLNVDDGTNQFVAQVLNVIDIGVGDYPDFTAIIDTPIPLPPTFTWKIIRLVEDAAYRSIDYKLQVDYKNYYYFTNSDQWVIYHTFNEGSYVGGRFYPTIGAVVCYDENDQQIHPTDIIFCPEVIFNNVFEGAKIIVKWAGAQSGKVCFNPGIGSDESQDQSRLIINIPKDDGLESIWRREPPTPLPIHQYRTIINKDSTISTHSTPLITTEPFMTVDAIDNGKVVQYALLNYEDNYGDISYCSTLRIKADKSFFKALDAKVNNITDVNTDIVHVMTIGFTDPSTVVGNLNSWLINNQKGRAIDPGYPDDAFIRNYISQEVYFPAGGDWVKYYSEVSPNAPYTSAHPMFIDNIGYSYEGTRMYPYQFKFYLHGKRSLSYEQSDAGVVDQDYGTRFMPNPSLEPITDHIIDFSQHELYKPLIKFSGLDGYVKILEKRKAFIPRATSDGMIEAEYIIEFPAAFGSSQFRYELTPDFYHKNWCLYNEFKGRMKRNSDTDRDCLYYQTTQIHYPVSMVKTGGFVQEMNERISMVSPDIFTTAVLVESGFELSTYRRADGGYDVSKNLVGKQTITYPKNSVYRQVMPNTFEIKQSTYGFWRHEIGVLSGEDDSNEAIPVNIDMKLFILYNNRKWNYDKAKYESYSGRENPAYTFEVDASTLLQDFSESFKDMPSLSDVKRWFTAYCRGYAHVVSSDRSLRVIPADSKSELVLEIWDNTTMNWRPINPSSRDDIIYHPNQYSNTAKIIGIFDGATMSNNKIALDSFIDIRVGDWVYIDPYANTYRVVRRITDSFHTYYELDKTITEGTGAVNLDFTAYYSDIYINDFLTYKFGAETVVSSTSKIKKYFDIKDAGVLGKYIRDNKMYFRMRINKASKYNVKKTTNPDVDVFNNGNPWSNNVMFNPSAINKIEEIQTIGIDYFKVESI